MIAEKYLIVIAGPTGIGKTKLAIAIAEKYQAEIVSADSRQFYKEIPIGTAQPTEEELSQVKHHFIANKSISEDYNVSNYVDDLTKFTKEYFQSHHVLVMAGGSGLFIDAFCDGLDEIPDVAESIRKDLNQEFEKFGLKKLLQELEEKDLDYFQEVDKSNPRRIIRALEVIRGTGEKFSSFRKKINQNHPFKIIKIALQQDRNLLYEKINNRVEQMLKDGLEEEVKSVIAFRNKNALNTVAYKEFFDYFDGKIDYVTTIDLIKRNSRRYAKRQLTWLRKDEKYHWMQVEDREAIFNLLEQEIK